MSSSRAESTAELERLVLRVICQGTPQGPVRSEALEILRRYSFVEPVHLVIFDALRELRTDDPRVLQEQLPAHLTSRGFPDVDFDDLFAPHAMTREKAIELMRRLAARGSSGSEPAS